MNSLKEVTLPGSGSLLTEVVKATHLLESRDAKEMLVYQHSGFSVDAGVCILAHDCAALERLLRYCARPAG